MTRSRFCLALVGLVLTTAPALAADLGQIERTIRKEPAYRSKAVKYCLLVFGPEAQTRVWLVQDGDTLYVDRNGNGDLTEAGEYVRAEKGEYTNPGEGIFWFKDSGDIREGTLLHKGLYLSMSKIDPSTVSEKGVKEYFTKNPDARRYLLGLDVEMP